MEKKIVFEDSGDASVGIPSRTLFITIDGVEDDAESKRFLQELHEVMSQFLKKWEWDIRHPMLSHYDEPLTKEEIQDRLFGIIPKLGDYFADDVEKNIENLPQEDKDFLDKLMSGRL